MTKETLLKAKEIDSEIKSLTKIKNALDSPYVNQIRCINYSGNQEVSATVIVDDALKQIIENYILQKIDNLEKELEDL